MMQHTNAIMNLFGDQLILTSEEIRAAGIHSQYVTSLINQRRIIRISQGKYIKADVQLSEMDKLVLAARIAPEGTICLLSALRFHKVLDEEPEEICIAMPVKRNKPQMLFLPVRYFTFINNTQYTRDQQHMINGTEIWVHSLEKALVDCFRLPHLINHDISVNALRTAANKNLIDYDELLEVSKICRYENRMRPYIEALNGPIKEEPPPPLRNPWDDDDEIYIDIGKAKQVKQ